MIRVLLIEDDSNDAELFRELLQAERISIDLRQSRELSSALALLSAEIFDIIVADLGLPDSNGIEAFSRLHTLHPQIPVIVLTGLDDEELALKAVQMGAQDYLVKGRVAGSMLARSIRYAIERQRLVTELEKSLKEIKTLKGLIPMCAWCRKIRDDRGYWKKVETYIQEQTDAAVTHGICPDCLQKIDPRAFEMIGKDKPDSDAPPGSSS
ncbi:MAG TPA: response regulator [Thermodesulfovibrionales bacterium]|nr:response regulator [Thermodesulfovibrionales bacterium]